MNIHDKIYVAGARGMVGSAICRILKKRGFNNILGPSSSELDLTDQSQTRAFFMRENPRYVFLAAAKVGGILANSTYPADFIRNNLAIQLNVIESARRSGVEKLLFMGSSCIYPRLAPQPLKEEYLLGGHLEPTNEPYAIAKIAGIIMCQSYNRQYGTQYISCLPTNLYGPGDNYHLEDSHVIPGLLARMHQAKLKGDAAFPVWGTGEPLREFMHVDDLARAALLLMEKYQDNSPINVGSGEECSIRELASLIKETIGFQGQLVWDPSKPDGTPRKFLETGKLRALGFEPKIPLRQGLKDTYQFFLRGE